MKSTLSYSPRDKWKKLFTGEIKFRVLVKDMKRGMEQVTPLQQTIIIQFGQLISLAGVLWGIVFSLMIEYYWMMVILIGAVIILGVQMLGNWQRKVMFKKQKEIYDNATLEVKGGLMK